MDTTGFDEKPDRYNTPTGREAIDVIRDSMTDRDFVVWCRGQARKYQLREGRKPGTNDAEKARWYLEMADHVHTGSRPDPRANRPGFEPYVRRGEPERIGEPTADVAALRHTAYRAGHNPLEGALLDEMRVNRAADEIESLRERLELHRQSSRAMARRAERAEQERDEALLAASVEAKLGDEARAEGERLRADLHAIWTTCTGVVSTHADGPAADNIPRRVEEMRGEVERLRRLALVPDLPDGWKDVPRLPFSASDGTLTVEVDDKDLAVEWSEGSDDHFGRTTRCAWVPLSVVRALLARIPVEALEVSDAD